MQNANGREQRYVYARICGTATRQHLHSAMTGARTIREEAGEDGRVDFVVERSRKNQMWNVGIAALAGSVFYVVTVLAYAASGSVLSLVLLVPAFATHAWLTYTLSIRRVAVTVTEDTVLHQAYVGRKKFDRAHVRAVDVRVRVPEARVHTIVEEKHYLAIHMDSGKSRVAFFDFDHEVLDTTSRRLRDVLALEMQENHQACVQAQDDVHALAEAVALPQTYEDSS